jgi:adenylate cyclase
VAVTVERSVGFVDLVGSTELVTSISVADLARLVEEFEQLVWDTVTRAGGRVVKLIGDEAMFVVDAAVDACSAALSLIESSPHPARVGLAHGPVVALRGDYYGGVVNLAARLVAAAPASTVLASSEVQSEAKDSFSFERFDTGPLRGFNADVLAYRVHRPG